MEDDLKKKWKSTSKKNGRQPQKKEKGRRPQKKWKTTTSTIEKNLIGSEIIVN